MKNNVLPQMLLYPINLDYYAGKKYIKKEEEKRNCNIVLTSHYMKHCYCNIVYQVGNMYQFK